MTSNKVTLLPDGSKRYMGLNVPLISDNIQTVYVAEGIYDGQTLCDTINKSMAKTMGVLWEETFCKFKYISTSNKIEITINGEDKVPDRRCSIVIFKNMAKILGFVKTEKATNFLFGAPLPKLLPGVLSLHTTKADPAYTCLMTLAKFNFIMIYVDILDHQVK